MNDFELMDSDEISLPPNIVSSILDTHVINNYLIADYHLFSPIEPNNLLDIEERLIVHDYLSILPRRQLLIMVLRFWNNAGISQIADYLKLPFSSIFMEYKIAEDKLKRTDALKVLFGKIKSKTTKNNTFNKWSQ